MPSFMRKSWAWWKRIARKIGDFQARILLTIFYFIFFAPFALAVRFLSDPLAIKNKSAPSWGMKAPSDEPVTEQARRQF
jgi:hypothetical protein